MKYSPLQLVAAIFLGLIASTLSIAGAYDVISRGDIGALPAWTLAAAAPVTALVLVLRRRNGDDRNSVPALVLAFLVSGVFVTEGCASMQRTACELWDGTHRVSCALCERTEGPCPLEHPHEPSAIAPDDGSGGSP